MKKLRSAGLSLAVIGGMIGFVGYMSASTTAGWIAVVLVLIGLLPIVLFPVMPKLNGKHAVFLRPAPAMGKKHHNPVNHDRRHGNPPY